MWERARNVDSLNLSQPMVADADLRPNLKAAVLDSFGFLPQKQKGPLWLGMAQACLTRKIGVQGILS